MTKTRFITTIGAFLLALGVACQSQTSPEPFSTATPSLQSGNVSTTTVATPAPQDYIISGMPLCQGMTDLRAPLKFDWPDIETALEKLANYNWGYYTCAMSQSELATFLHDEIVKPPYLWREVNHAEHSSGQVVLYYQRFTVTFMYIWTLPKPGTQTSYMIIARGDPGTPQTWECRRWVSPLGYVAVLGTPMRLWSQ